MKYLHLCLHTLRADCNGLSIVRMKLKCTFASTRSVQIATVKSIGNRLHTIFASTRSVQIATGESSISSQLSYFASTRSVQIATNTLWDTIGIWSLCLHTLRADCNITGTINYKTSISLPPHAPCRLQHILPNIKTTTLSLCLHTLRADCNPKAFCTLRMQSSLPPHAPCRLQQRIQSDFRKCRILCLHTLRADCNRRK